MNNNKNHKIVFFLLLVTFYFLLSIQIFSQKELGSEPIMREAESNRNANAYQSWPCGFMIKKRVLVTIRFKNHEVQRVRRQKANAVDFTVDFEMRDEAVLCHKPDFSEFYLLNLDDKPDVCTVDKHDGFIMVWEKDPYDDPPTVYTYSKNNLNIDRSEQIFAIEIRYPSNAENCNVEFRGFPGNKPPDHYPWGAKRNGGTDSAQVLDDEKGIKYMITPAVMEKAVEQGLFFKQFKWRITDFMYDVSYIDCEAELTLEFLDEKEFWRIAVQGVELDDMARPIKGSDILMKFTWNLVGEITVERKGSSLKYLDGVVFAADITPTFDFQKGKIKRCWVPSFCRNRTDINKIIGAPIEGTVLGKSVQLKWPEFIPRECGRCEHLTTGSSRFEREFIGRYDFLDLISIEELPLVDGKVIDYPSDENGTQYRITIVRSR